MEATVDVWYRESEMAKGKKSSLSESVALNDLKWQRRQGRFVILVVQ